MRRGLCSFLGLCLITIFLLGLAWWNIPACPHPLEGVPFSQLVFDRHGNLLRLSLADDQIFRVRVALQDIPPHVIEATLRYEDKFYWQHPGVNPFSMLRAAVSMAFGGRRLGGSTITMQVVRLRDRLNTTSFTGKWHQIFRALQLERHYGKDTILEAYFNLAPYGGNIEGLGAATRIYFHKQVQKLTSAESTALAVVPQNPNKRRPSITNTTFHTARRLLAPEAAPLRIFSIRELPFIAPHLTDELLNTQTNIHEIHTSLDTQQQTALSFQLQNFVFRHGAYGINNAAALLVHWPSMEVRALHGSADFHSQTISGQVDGTKALRSPGSTLKPFIYALALEQGLIHPRTLLIDTPQSFSGYDPENFDKTFRGPIHAAEALRTSRNVPAVHLAAQLHAPDLYDFLQQNGLTLPQTREHYGLALVLGGAETTMRQLAQLYAMLANGGVLKPLRPTLNTSSTAPILQTHALPKKNTDNMPTTATSTTLQAFFRQSLSPEAAFITLAMLTDHTVDKTVETIQGTRLPVRFKTGTSNGFRDAWTVGIIGPYVLVVWVGHFDNRSNPFFVGSELALPLFMDIIQHIVQQTPTTELLQAETSLSTPKDHLNVVNVSTCTATGDIDTRLCKATTEDWFIPGTSPIRSSEVFRTIMVDTQTGLRLCFPKEGRTKQQVAEFWPGELARLFAHAGIPKPLPPSYEPECLDGRALPGKAPSIIQPKAGLTYFIPKSNKEHQMTPSHINIPLFAESDADANSLYWFANNRFIGQSMPGKTLLWQAESGKYVLRVVDNLGRTTSRTINVLVTDT